MRERVEKLFAADFAMFPDRWDFAKAESAAPWTDAEIATAELHAMYGRRFGDLRNLAIDYRNRAADERKRADLNARKVRQLTGTAPSVASAPATVRSPVRAHLRRQARAGKASPGGWSPAPAADPPRRTAAPTTVPSIGARRHALAGAVRPTAPSSKRPRFTLVSAVYNVGRYLDEFIASIEKQTFDLSRVEVILVDDGSTDDSLAQAKAWQQRRPELVKILTKTNGGQASARNLGLEHATGQWVSFPDPDDVLDRKYLAEFDAFARETPRVQLMAANRITFSDATGEQSKHPLHVHFTKYNRLRDLTLDTGHFHGHAVRIVLPPRHRARARSSPSTSASGRASRTGTCAASTCCASSRSSATSRPRSTTTASVMTGRRRST